MHLGEKERIVLSVQGLIFTNEITSCALVRKILMMKSGLFILLFFDYVIYYFYYMFVNLCELNCEAN